ncbi:tyrosine-type recombinase/integrase [Chloroflexota bacterium]
MIRDLLKHQDTELVSVRDLGRIANMAASLGAFEDYKSRKAEQTLRRHKGGLKQFAEYLKGKGVEVGNLYLDPLAWEGITWGLVAAFQKWLLLEGYAVETVNARISTIKTFAKLATKAGAVDVAEYAMIKAVEGYSRTEGKRVDDQREDTRQGHKKAEAVSITKDQAESLKAQDTSTDQGKRDAVIMALLLDHGLRVGELAALAVESINIEAGQLTFYRSKVDKWDTQSLTGDTWRVLPEYLGATGITKGALLRGSVRGGDLATGGMSTRAINKRVGYLGDRAGIEGLSPHDCRHYAATKDANKGKSIYWLMEKYGWTSPATAIRYIEAAAVIETE